MVGREAGQVTGDLEAWGRHMGYGLGRTGWEGLLRRPPKEGEGQAVGRGGGVEHAALSKGAGRRREEPQAR